jgi:hypothetical protein
MATERNIVFLMPRVLAGDGVIQWGPFYQKVCGIIRLQTWISSPSYKASCESVLYRAKKADVQRVSTVLFRHVWNHVKLESCAYCLSHFNQTKQAAFWGDRHEWSTPRRFPCGHGPRCWTMCRSISYLLYLPTSTFSCEHSYNISSGWCCFYSLF